MSNIQRKEFVKEVAQKTAVPRNIVNRVLEAAFQTITERTLQGDTVKFVGFGKFEKRTYPKRTARNPNTGEKVQVPGYSKVVFVPSKMLKVKEE